ncbi:MAG TPA: SDR family NAD(P)-dependent oxidoreductase [Cellulomonas sp.]
MNGPLAGRVCVVTGAAERVGAVLARTFAAAGATVVVDHLGQGAQAAEVVASIEADGGRALAVEADVTDPATGPRIVELCDRELGRLDILVHNASTFVEAPFESVTPAQFDRVLAVNLRGPFFLSQAVGAYMRAQGSGTILGILGNSLYEAWPDFAAHTVSKVALAKLLQVLAIEYAPVLQVNGVAPARILASPSGQDTRIAGSRGESQDLDPSGVRLARGSAEQLADFLVQLCLAPPVLNGAIIPLDGGKSVL